MAILKTEQNLIDALKELCLGFECIADYHPLGGDIIYHTADYFGAKRDNLPTKGIEIVDALTGEPCGFIHDDKPMEIEWYDNEKD